MTSRGIVGAGAYLPHRRLDLATVAPVAGGGGAKASRTVAGYDEDTTTMGVEAGRLALAALGETHADAIDALWFSTVAPAYADKTNATTVHAALRLAPRTPAFDANGAVRSAVGALRAALMGHGTHLIVSADLRTGLAGGADESAFGDGAVALVVADDSAPLPVLAEVIGVGAATEEFLDRWRTPGSSRSKVWEERFGETRYVPLGAVAWDDALKDAGLVANQIDLVVMAGTHTRANAALARSLAITDRLVVAHADLVGNLGAAQPGFGLTAALEQARPGQVVALVSLSDGADVMIFRVADAIATWRPGRPVAEQVTAGAPISYGTYLRWRGLLPVEPPRRPEPARPSASAARRSGSWKLGFVGSANEAGEVHLPPHPNDATSVPMADATGSVVTFTVDRLAYSPSPPVVFAVVDFDGGGRLPVELTDVELEHVHTGARVELTFRRLFTSDDIHNYFWKARLD
jgi:3-hydroxy-3-methylglutaryl CoA synthase/uncharacterized OB-fold protein